MSWGGYPVHYGFSGFSLLVVLFVLLVIVGFGLSTTGGE